MKGLGHLIGRGVKYLTNEDYRFLVKSGKGFCDSMPDEEYLKRMFKARMGRELNLENPQTFNEKLQWLKLYDRKSIYSTMVDKYAVKKYVADIIGEQYIIPTLGVWDRFDDINFDSLPDQFVLKCTHDSGGLIICKDKSKLDIGAARKKINRSLKRNFYYLWREWPYKDVEPRIIAEKYMEDRGLQELCDYKFFCFGGQARCYKVDFDRFIEHHANYYDMDNHILEFGESAFLSIPGKELSTSKEVDQMAKLAEKLSQDIPSLRADFYDVEGKIYFGELTFYPVSGFGPFTKENADLKFGQWTRLPDSFGRGEIILILAEVIVWFHPNVKRQDSELKDYKFYCFDGEMKMVMINSDRKSVSGTRADYFDRQFNYLDFTWGYKHADVTPQKPKNFENMVKLAEQLSVGLKHIRVDLYNCDGQIYFGELTFFDGSGFDRIEPIEWDSKIGEWLNLSGRGTAQIKN